MCYISTRGRVEKRKPACSDSNGRISGQNQIQFLTHHSERYHVIVSFPLLRQREREGESLYTYLGMYNPDSGKASW